jgi:MFS family permease
MAEPEGSGGGRNSRGLPSNVVWLGVVSFLNDFSSEMIFPLLPLFFTGVLGGSPAILGAMEGLVDSLASLLKLGSGWLGDRIPRRKPLIVAGYSLTSFIRIVLAVASAPWQVLLVRIVDRTGKGLRGAPRDALIADSVPVAIRGRAFGFHRAMDHLGAIAGPVTALLLIPFLFGSGPLTERDYRVLFGIAVVPAMVSLLALGYGVKETAKVRSGGPAGDRVRFSRGFWYLLGVIFLFTLGNSSDAFLILRAHDAGLSERSIFLIWALLHLVKAALSTPAGALSDRIPRRWVIVAGWLVYAGVYFGFGRATATWHIWALFGLYGLYFAFAEGAEKALVADLVPAEARSTAYGWYNAAVGLGALPASLLFGWLWSTRGPAAAFGLGCGLALTAAVLLVLGAPQRRVLSIEH